MAAPQAPGTLGQEGVVDGTFLTGTGSGTKSATIPTAAGAQKMSFSFTMIYVPGVGLKSSDALMGPLTFVFYPSVGNGVTEPVTEIAVVAEFALKS